MTRLCRFCDKSSETDFYGDSCRAHFIELFEKKVLSTIKKFELLSKEEKIGVAASGGKDSTAILYILNKNGYKLTAICIDEGIPDYRDKSLEDLKEFCGKENIPLKVASFKEEIGTQLQDLLESNKNIKSCRTCGVFRRSLIARNSEEFDKIVTGHNMDDEAQSIMMNIASGNTALLGRLGPASGSDRKEFTRRVKPLYFCSEKEVATYAFFKDLRGVFNECPHMAGSIRNKFRDLLNVLEEEEKGSKQILVNWLISNKEYFMDKRPLLVCKECGKPASRELCSFCIKKSEIKVQNVY